MGAAGLTRAGKQDGGLAAIGWDSSSERDAEHIVRLLTDRLAERGLDGGPVLCTHRVASGSRRHVAVSVQCPDLSDHALGALLGQLLPELPVGCAVVSEGRQAGARTFLEGTLVAVAVARSRCAGRAVRFPGSPALNGRMRVRDLLENSALDAVRVLAAGEAAPDAVVDTRDHVRPEWVDRHLVLTVQPAAGGLLVPFEAPSPTPCCAVHG